VILADSNIVIYSRKLGYDELRRRLAKEQLTVCSTVQIEVLGWSHLLADDYAAFKKLFAQIVNYSLDDMVIDRAIEIRQKYIIELPDAIIAATALAHKLTLWTANTKDFQHIAGLKLYNPIDEL
jgi:predicted nucleic acid-binding protein